MAEETSDKTVVLVSKDGNDKVEVPASDKTYITQLVSGRGYSVQEPGSKSSKKGSATQ